MGIGMAGGEADMIVELRLMIRGGGDKRMMVDIKEGVEMIGVGGGMEGAAGMIELLKPIEMTGQEGEKYRDIMSGVDRLR